jgi:hypothetical protein
MDDTEFPKIPTPKRSDVGYKRPPVEHQFKRGRKPPPRKKRPASQNVSPTRIMILREEVRVDRGRKVHWMTNAALLVEVAFQLAEKGNPTVTRALVDYLMAGEPPPSQEIKMIVLD